MRTREKIYTRLCRCRKEKEKIQCYINELENANDAIMAKGSHQTKADRNERQNNTEEILYSQGRLIEIKEHISFLRDLIGEA